MGRTVLISVLSIVFGAGVMFGALRLADHAESTTDAASTGPTQYEVVGKGVGGEGQLVYFYVRFNSYGTTEEWRGVGGDPDARSCWDDATIGEQLPEECRQ